MRQIFGLIIATLASAATVDPLIALPGVYYIKCLSLPLHFMTPCGFLSNIHSQITRRLVSVNLGVSTLSFEIIATHKIKMSHNGARACYWARCRPSNWPRSMSCPWGDVTFGQLRELV